jgi:excisionase family DNA binding protein
MERSSTSLLMDARDTARALCISERKLWGMTASGEIPHVRIGRSVRYSIRDIDAWIDKNTKGGQP